MPSNFVIYGHADPRSGELRYIGQTSVGSVRQRRHVFDSRRRATHHATWIRSLPARVGQLPFDVVILEEFDSAELLNDAESEWILAARAVGVRLTNHTDGGAGARGYKPTREAIEKTAAFNRGRKRPTHVVARLIEFHTGRVRSDEARARMRAAHASRSAESNEKNRRSHLGKKATPEERAARSAFQTGKKRGPYRARVTV